MKPLAYFITWTTYGTWLPGDKRGWVDRHEWGIKPGQSRLAGYAKKILKEEIVTFTKFERDIVEKAIENTCVFKKWNVHAIAIRSNHIHIVISTDGINPKQIMKTLKNYSTRALKNIERLSNRTCMWTKGGSIRFLNDRESVSTAIEYIENQ